MATPRLNTKTEQPSAWELGSNIFGKYASGKDNQSTDRKTLAKQKINDKR